MNPFNKISLSILLVWSTSFYVNAQNYTVKGLVLDTAGLPLPGAMVKIKWDKDSLGISANTDGAFTISKIKAKQFTLSASYIGFRAFVKDYIIDKGNTVVIPNIKLLPLSNTLDDVVISGAPPVKISEDTVTFNAAAFPVRDGDAVDEILKKLPGIEVDRDGNVTNQGTPVTKIRINGKDFFGTDVATAIKNLPADIIKNLQFIDDYGDQAKLTGIKTGEPEKILNLTIQEDKKKGYFTRASGGMGSADRYNASLKANSMKGERMITFDGTTNNSNSRGGGDGITTRNSAGVNYKNEFNEKLSADGSYSFDNSRNNTLSSAFTQNFLQRDGIAFTRLENSRNANNNTRNGHEFNGNIEYKIDTMNYLKVTPNLSYNNNTGDNDGGSLINQEQRNTNRISYNQNKSNSFNFRTNVFYNHKFSKKGRNFSFWGNVNFSNGDNFRNVFNRYEITEPGLDSLRIQNQLNDQENRFFGTNAGASYMEPLWTKTYIEVSYNYNYSATNNLRDVKDIVNDTEVFNPNLSNNFDYQFITNRIGMNYRFIGEKLNYTVGVNAQPVLLTGQNVTRGINTRNETFNVIPSARLSYKFSNQQSFDINYWGRSNQPGFLQLQPLTDNSNLQNIVTGNPDLDPEFVHGLNAHYKQSDWQKGFVLFVNGYASQTSNKIVTTKIQVPNTIDQLTSYTNTDGYKSLGGDYYYGQPFAERKFTIGYSGSASTRNEVNFIDLNKNTATVKQWRQAIEFKVDLKDVVDLKFETSYSENRSTYTLPSFEPRQTNRLQFGLYGRNFFFEDLTLGYDFSKTINSGFQTTNVVNPTILRLYMEYRFLKQNSGTLRVDGYDLFNQNTGISRDVFDNVIVDRQVNRLGRYFMLSFIYRMRKYG